jgi:hypothetical protein
MSKNQKGKRFLVFLENNCNHSRAFVKLFESDRCFGHPTVDDVFWLAMEEAKEIEIYSRLRKSF